MTKKQIQHQKDRAAERQAVRERVEIQGKLNEVTFSARGVTHKHKVRGGANDYRAEVRHVQSGMLTEGQIMAGTQARTHTSENAGANLHHRRYMTITHNGRDCSNRTTIATITQRGDNVALRIRKAG